MLTVKKNHWKIQKKNDGKRIDVKENFPQDSLETLSSVFLQSLKVKAFKLYQEKYFSPESQIFILPICSMHEDFVGLFCRICESFPQANQIVVLLSQQKLSRTQKINERHQSNPKWKDQKLKQKKLLDLIGKLDKDMKYEN